MLDVHTTQKVAGSDVDSVSVLVGTSLCLVTGAADETVALHYHIYIGGNKQLHATQESVDVNVLVLADNGLAQVQSQPTTEGIQSSTVERHTPKGVTIGTKIGRTVDALAILAKRQWTLQPL